jgi:hypothetical protein
MALRWAIAQRLFVSMTSSAAIGFVSLPSRISLLIDDRTILRALIVLAITQLIGWGTIGLTAVIGRRMAADLDLDLAVVFAGSSVLYLVMGLCSPLLASLQ